jgi:hypothetical protein
VASRYSSKGGGRVKGAIKVFITPTLEMVVLPNTQILPKKERTAWIKEKKALGWILFASKGEARRYIELKTLEHHKLIKDLELQPKFPLWITEPISKIKYYFWTYIADFKYRDIELGEIVVEDVKGMKTEIYLKKSELFQVLYPQYYFLETCAGKQKSIKAFS